MNETSVSGEKMTQFPINLTELIRTDLRPSSKFIQHGIPLAKETKASASNQRQH